MPISILKSSEDQTLVDQYILARVEVAVTLLNQYYSQWKFLIDESNPTADSQHENPMDIDFETLQVTYTIATEDDLNDDGCGLKEQPIYPYNASKWHMHTHPNRCSKTINKTICETIMNKQASAAINSMSGTDVNLLISSTISYSTSYGRYTPSVDGIVCEDGVIFYWLTEEFVKAFVRAMVTHSIPMDTVYDMIDDMSSDFVREACTHLTSTPELASMSTEDQIASLLRAVKNASFLPEPHTDPRQELDGKNNYGFWVSQQYHFVFVPSKDLQKSTA